MSLSDPTRKMSKSDDSDKGYIGLFEAEASLRKKVRAAVTATDTTTGQMSPGVENLFEILKACDKTEMAAEFLTEFRTGTIRYADLKDAVADALVQITSQLIQNRADVEGSQEELDRRLKEMTEKTRALARQTLREVKQVTGLPVFE
jgi:tryptophanyl-tRNA synthetase